MIVSDTKFKWILMILGNYILKKIGITFSGLNSSNSEISL